MQQSMLLTGRLCRCLSPLSEPCPSLSLPDPFQIALHPTVNWQMGLWWPKISEPFETCFQSLLGSFVLPACRCHGRDADTACSTHAVPTAWRGHGRHDCRALLNRMLLIGWGGHGRDGFQRHAAKLVSAWSDASRNPHSSGCICPQVQLGMLCSLPQPP